jgi:hypothetical protein
MYGTGSQGLPAPLRGCNSGRVPIPAAGRLDLLRSGARGASDARTTGLLARELPPRAAKAHCGAAKHHAPSISAYTRGGRSLTSRLRLLGGTSRTIGLRPALALLSAQGEGIEEWVGSCSSRRRFAIAKALLPVADAGVVRLSCVGTSSSRVH